MSVHVLRAPAGSGKTQAYVRRIAAQSPNTLIEVYVPTIKLAEEVKRSIDALGTNHRVAVIQGRDWQPQKGYALCARHGLARQVVAKGISVFPTLCMRRGPNGSESCRHYEYCGYINQYLRCNVRIYTHAHLLVGRTMLDEDLPEIVVIDEDFTRQLIEQVEVSHSLIQYVAGIADYVGAMKTVQLWCLTRDDQALLQSYQSQQGGVGSWPKLVDALKKHRPAISPREMDQFTCQLVAQHQNVRPVALMLEHLDKVLAKGLFPTAVDVRSNGLVVHHRHEVTRFGDLNDSNAPDVFIVDATISEMLIRRCMPVDSFKEISSVRNAFIYQCADSICSTSSLLETKQPSAEKRSRARARLGDVQALVDELSATGQKVLVIGPTAVTGNPSAGIQPLLTHSSNVELAHFGAIRGIDTWKDMDVLVLIGRNEPGAKQVENIARAIFYDDPAPLQLPGQWATRQIGYLMTSCEQLGVEVPSHPDPRVHEVLMQLREAESIQALDRLRLIHNDSPKLVIIMSKLPLPGVQVEALLDWKTLTRGSDFERLYRQNGNILPLNACWVATQIGKSVEAAKAAIRRIKGHNLLRFNRWAMTLLNAPHEARYRLDGQKKWSRFWHGLPSLTDAKAALEAMLGAVVTVK